MAQSWVFVYLIFLHFFARVEYMSHLTHIAKNKDLLKTRFAILRAIRDFFYARKFVEVEAPHIVKLAGQEPNIAPMQLSVHDEKTYIHDAYLHTSPEYSMKKMIAAGMGDIFYLGKCFRDFESFGGLHNPEFTMLEWYEVGKNMFDVMETVEELLSFILNKKEIGNWKLETGTFERIHMRELWKKYVGVNLDNYLTVEEMRRLCVEKDCIPVEDERYEELFYRIFLRDIEPALKERGTIIVHHYPAQMASLAKLSHEDPRYAERFEVYIDGIEIANAFSELTDADEQMQRLQKEREERMRDSKTVYNIDIEFIDALRVMPECAGIALGVDRLVQILLGCKNIDDVVPFPMSTLFE